MLHSDLECLNVPLGNIRLLEKLVFADEFEHKNHLFNALPLTGPVLAGVPLLSAPVVEQNKVQRYHQARHDISCPALAVDGVKQLRALWHVVLWKQVRSMVSLLFIFKGNQM